MDKKINYTILNYLNNLYSKSKYILLFLISLTMCSFLYGENNNSTHINNTNEKSNDHNSFTEYELTLSADAGLIPGLGDSYDGYATEVSSSVASHLFFKNIFLKYKRSVYQNAKTILSSSSYAAVTGCTPEIIVAGFEDTNPDNCNGSLAPANLLGNYTSFTHDTDRFDHHLTLTENCSVTLSVVDIDDTDLSGATYIGTFAETLMGCTSLSGATANTVVFTPCGLGTYNVEFSATGPSPCPSGNSTDARITIEVVNDPDVDITNNTTDIALMPIANSAEICSGGALDLDLNLEAGILTTLTNAQDFYYFELTSINVSGGNSSTCNTGGITSPSLSIGDLFCHNDNINQIINNNGDDAATITLGITPFLDESNGTCSNTEETTTIIVEPTARLQASSTSTNFNTSTDCMTYTDGLCGGGDVDITISTPTVPSTGDVDYIISTAYSSNLTSGGNPYTPTVSNGTVRDNLESVVESDLNTSDGNCGTVIYTLTPFIDENGDNVQDATECSGTSITITINVLPSIDLDVSTSTFDGMIADDPATDDGDPDWNGGTDRFFDGILICGNDPMSTGVMDDAYVCYDVVLNSTSNSLVSCAGATTVEFEIQSVTSNGVSLAGDASNTMAAPMAQDEIVDGNTLTVCFQNTTGSTQRVSYELITQFDTDGSVSTSVSPDTDGDEVCASEIFSIHFDIEPIPDIGVDATVTPPFGNPIFYNSINTDRTAMGGLYSFNGNTISMCDGDELSLLVDNLDNVYNTTVSSPFVITPSSGAVAKANITITPNTDISSTDGTFPFNLGDPPLMMTVTLPWSPNFGTITNPTGNCEIIQIDFEPFIDSDNDDSPTGECLGNVVTLEVEVTSSPSVDDNAIATSGNLINIISTTKPVDDFTANGARVIDTILLCGGQLIGNPVFAPQTFSNIGTADDIFGTFTIDLESPIINTCNANTQTEFELVGVLNPSGIVRDTTPTAPFISDAANADGGFPLNSEFDNAAPTVTFTEHLYNPNCSASTITYKFRVQLDDNNILEDNSEYCISDTFDIVVELEPNPNVVVDIQTTNSITGVQNNFPGIDTDETDRGTNNLYEVIICNKDNVSFSLGNTCGSFIPSSLHGGNILIQERLTIPIGDPAINVNSVPLTDVLPLTNIRNFGDTPTFDIDAVTGNCGEVRVRYSPFIDINNNGIYNPSIDVCVGNDVFFQINVVSFAEFNPDLSMNNININPMGFGTPTDSDTSMPIDGDSDLVDGIQYCGADMRVVASGTGTSDDEFVPFNIDLASGLTICGANQQIEYELLDIIVSPGTMGMDVLRSSHPSGDSLAIYVDQNLASNSTASGTLSNATSVTEILDGATLDGIYEFEEFLLNNSAVVQTIQYVFRPQIDDNNPVDDGSENCYGEPFTVEVSLDPNPAVLVDVNVNGGAVELDDINTNESNPTDTVNIINICGSDEVDFSINGAWFNYIDSTFQNTMVMGTNNVFFRVSAISSSSPVNASTTLMNILTMPQYYLHSGSNPFNINLGSITFGSSSCETIELTITPFIDNGGTAMAIDGTGDCIGNDVIVKIQVAPSPDIYVLAAGLNLDVDNDDVAPLEDNGIADRPTTFYMSTDSIDRIISDMTICGAAISAGDNNENLYANDLYSEFQFSFPALPVSGSCTSATNNKVTEFELIGVSSTGGTLGTDIFRSTTQIDVTASPDGGHTIATNDLSATTDGILDDGYEIADGGMFTEYLFNNSDTFITVTYSFRPQLDDMGGAQDNNELCFGDTFYLELVVEPIPALELDVDINSTSNTTSDSFGIDTDDSANEITICENDTLDILIHEGWYDYVNELFVDTAITNNPNSSGITLLAIQEVVDFTMAPNVTHSTGSNNIDNVNANGVVPPTTITNTILNPPTPPGVTRNYGEIVTLPGTIDCQVIKITYTPFIDNNGNGTLEISECIGNNVEILINVQPTADIDGDSTATTINNSMINVQDFTDNTIREIDNILLCGASTTSDETQSCDDEFVPFSFEFIAPDGYTTCTDSHIEYELINVTTTGGTLGTDVFRSTTQVTTGSSSCNTPSFNASGTTYTPSVTGTGFATSGIAGGYQVAENDTYNPNTAMATPLDGEDDDGEEFLAGDNFTEYLFNASTNVVEVTYTFRPQFDASSSSVNTLSNTETCFGDTFNIVVMLEPLPVLEIDATIDGTITEIGIGTDDGSSSPDSDIVVCNGDNLVFDLNDFGITPNSTYRVIETISNPDGIVASGTQGAAINDSDTTDVLSNVLRNFGALTNNGTDCNTITFTYTPYIDAANDGNYDTIIDDLDGDGVQDPANEDLDGNGMLDIGEDTDGDGNLDVMETDINGDGDFDLYIDCKGNEITIVVHVEPTPDISITPTYMEACSDASFCVDVELLTCHEDGAGFIWELTNPVTGISGHSTVKNFVDFNVNGPGGKGSLSSSDFCQTIINHTDIPIILRYEVTPYSWGYDRLDNSGVNDDCLGTPQIVEVLLKPSPDQPTLTASSEDICLGGQVVINSQLYTGSNVEYYWYLKSEPTPGSGNILTPSVGTSTDISLESNEIYNTDQIDADPLTDGTYTYGLFTIVNGCISDTSFINIVVSDQLGVLDTTITNASDCDAFDGTINIAGLEDNEPYTVSYNFNGGSSQIFTYNSSSIGDLTISGLGYGNYSNFILTNDIGCKSLPTNITVNATNATAIIPSNNGPVCLNESVQLSTGSTDGVSFEWLNSDGNVVSTIENPTINNITQDSTFDVIVTYANGCTSMASTTVMLNTAILTTVPTNSGPVCANESVTLSTGSTGGVSYMWTNSDGDLISTLENPTITGITQDSTFDVVVTYADGCTSMASTTVMLNTAILTTVPTNSGPVCANESVTLSTGSTGGVTFAWTNSDGDLVSTDENPTITGITQDSTFDVVVTYADGCTSMASTTVMLNTTVLTTVPTNSGPVCANESVTLSTGSTGGVSYMWTNSDGDLISNLENPTINNITQDSTFDVVVTYADGCTSMASTTVNLNDTPLAVVNINGNETCVDGTTSIDLGATVTGGTGSYVYSWTGPNDFTSSLMNPQLTNINNSMSGTYILTVSSGGCMSIATSVNVNITDQPVSPTLSISASEVCAGESITVSSTGNYQGSSVVYNWNDGTGVSSINSNSYTFTPTASGNVQLSVMVDGCMSNQVMLPYTVHTISSDPVVSNNPSGCGLADGNITIENVLQDGAAPIAGFNISYTDTNGNTQTAVNQMVMASTNNLVISNLPAGTYSNISVTSSNGCAMTYNGAISLSDPNSPSIAASTNAVLCLDGTDDLELESTVTGGTAPFTYAWSGPNNFSSSDANPMRSAAGLNASIDSGTYTVEVVDANGCSSSNTVSVILTEAPAQAQLSAINSICLGEDIVVSSNAYTGSNVIYNWDTDNDGITDISNSSNQLTLTPSAAGSQTVNLVVNVNGCASSAATLNYDVVDFDENAFIISATNPTTCEDDDGLIVITGLTAGNAYDVQYSLNAGTNQSTTGLVAALNGRIFLNNLSTGAYTNFILTNSDGCSSSISGGTILSDPNPPDAPTAIATVSICEGENVSLDLTTLASDYPVGSTFSWTGPSGYTSNDYEPVILNTSVANQGTYSVVVTTDGCTSDPTAVQVNVTTTPATPDISGIDALCNGESIALSSSATCDVYQWTGPGGIVNTTTTNSFTADSDDAAYQSGSWSLICINEEGCTSNASPVLSVQINDDINTANPISSGNNCEGDDVILSPGTGFIAGASYQWFDGLPGATGVNLVSTQGAATITDLENGSYTYYLVISDNGCTSDPAPVTFTISETPSVFVNNNGGLCNSDLELTSGVSPANGSYTYEWSGPNGYTSDEANPVIINPSDDNIGTYTLLVTNANGCESEMMITDVMTISGTPSTPVINSVSSICEGDDLILSVDQPLGGNSVVYTWEFDDGNGFGTIPGLVGSQVTLTNVNDNNTGDYRVFVNVNGCTSFFSTVQSVDVFVGLDAPAPSANEVCEGDNLTLNSNVIADAYLWTGPSFTSTDANIVIPNASSANNGMYTLQYFNDEGCVSAMGSVEVNVNSVPNAPSIATVSSLCEGENFTLSTSANCNSYRWSGPNGDFNTSIASTTISSTNANYSAGMWSVVCVNSSGCASTSSEAIEVVINEFPNNPAPLAIGAVCPGDEVALNPGVPNIPGAIYTWYDQHPSNGSATVVSNEYNPTISNFSTGINFYFVTIEQDGCISEAVEAEFEVNETPVVEITNNGGSCGEQLILNSEIISGSGNYTYLWTGPNGFMSNEANPIIDNPGNTLVGTFTLVVNDADGCESAEAFTQVSTISQLGIQSTIDGNLSVCEGDDITLTTNAMTGEDVVYEWILVDADGVSTPFETTLPSLDLPAISPTNNGSFITVAAVVDGCSTLSSESMFFDITATPLAPSITVNEGICDGENITLETQQQDNATYTWSGPNGFTSNIYNPVIPNASSENVGTYTLQVAINDCISEVANMEVAINSLPDDVQVSNNGPVCEGQDITLLVSNPDGTSQYFWYNEDSGAFVGSGTLLVLSGDDVIDNESYYVVVQSSTGCTFDPVALGSSNGFTSIEVTEMVINSAQAGPDGISCDGTYLLSATAINPLSGGSGFWSDNNAQTVISNVNDATTTVTNLSFGLNTIIWQIDNGVCGIASTDTVFVTYVDEPLVFDDGYESTFNTPLENFNPLENDELANGFHSIFGVTQPANGSVAVNDDGTLTYTPEASFTGTDEFFYTVCSDDCPASCAEGLISINIAPDETCNPPTLFTPNNDGLNDSFIVPCLALYPGSSLAVFNRWGDEVYRNSDYQNDWTGTYEGQNLPVATYFYVLEVNDSESNVLTGYVYIQRE